MTNDGTQDPVPPPVLSDPLAGLVTGSRYEPEPLRVRVTDPPMPDLSLVRQAMANVLDEDSVLDLGQVAAAEAPGQPAPGKPVAEVPVSEVPAQPPGEAPPEPARAPVNRPSGQVPTRGAVTRVPPAPGGRAGETRQLPSVITTGERARRIRLPSGFRPRGPKLPPRVRGQSSAGSVTLIMVLLLVMAVLAIVFFASLIDTIAGVFD